jgi:hypothetical protein
LRSAGGIFMKTRHWLAAALVSIATPAAADSVLVDGTRFRYAVPDGYCSLDLDHSGQAQLFEQTAAKVAEQDLKLVVGFNTCAELAALGAKAPRNAAPDGMISVLAKPGGAVARLGMSRGEFLAKIRERHDVVSWPRAEAELAELAAGAGKVVRLGMLAEDGRAVYVGTALRSTGGVYANLVAFTLVEGRAFQISLTRPLDGRDSFELLLAQQRAMVAAFRP